jgi:hypothetical protein
MRVSGFSGKVWCWEREGKPGFPVEKCKSVSCESEKMSRVEMVKNMRKKFEALCRRFDVILSIKKSLLWVILVLHFLGNVVTYQWKNERMNEWMNNWMSGLMNELPLSSMFLFQLDFRAKLLSSIKLQFLNYTWLTSQTSLDFSGFPDFLHRGEGSPEKKLDF